MESDKPKTSQLPDRPLPPALPSKPQRDFLLHLESYLSRRDGVDKILKISRYAAKIALSFRAPLPSGLSRRLKSFESSVGLSRKAFRLGKFVQDVNALRSSITAADSSVDLLFLSIIAYGGEGVYYFIEQLVWLSKAGLIGPHHARQLQKLSAWAELIGYIGSIAIKVREISAMKSQLQISTDDAKSAKLREKLTLKQLSTVQDIADALMALADVRDGKGKLTDPLLMASAGMVSALISTHKNWNSC